ncbi:MAG: hypothetical protein AABW68_00890 [archaeon]
MVASNIGPKGQKMRQWVGYTLLMIGGILIGYLLANHSPYWHRIIVFPFLAGGFISLLQAKSKVCVYNAYRKKVETD